MRPAAASSSSSSGSKKRKRLEAGEGGAVVSPRFEVAKCDHGNGSFERHFVYRLWSSSPVPSVPAPPPCSSSPEGAPALHLWLDALVMANGICVLTFPASAVSEHLSMHRVAPAAACTMSYDAELHQSPVEISGKRKKGAKKVQVGSRILFLLGPGPVQIVLHSPVPGQLLEINKRLVDDGGGLLRSQPQGAGYVAVVYPGQEIPSLDNGGVIRGRNDNCFAFQDTGQCSRGAQCKFRHELNM